MAGLCAARRIVATRVAPTFSRHEAISHRGHGPLQPHEAAAPLSQFPLQLLSEQQRQVIEMLFQHGLSVEAAAARLGVEQQTIRSAKHKALTRLREALKRHLESPKEAENQGISPPPPATTTRKNDDAAR